jgi:hypothetical protein
MSEVIYRQVDPSIPSTRHHFLNTRYWTTRSSTIEIHIALGLPIITNLARIDYRLQILVGTVFDAGPCASAGAVIWRECVSKTTTDRQTESVTGRQSGRYMHGAAAILVRPRAKSSDVRCIVLDSAGEAMD